MVIILPCQGRDGGSIPLIRSRIHNICWKDLKTVEFSRYGKKAPYWVDRINLSIAYP